MSSESKVIEDKIEELKKQIEELEEKKKSVESNNRHKNKNSEYYCYRCCKNFDSYRSLERHGWEIHPSNEYERAWANKDWSAWTGSSYYEDDPYY